MRIICLTYAVFFGMVLAHSDAPVPTLPSADAAHHDVTVPAYASWGPLGVCGPVEDVAL